MRPTARSQAITVWGLAGHYGGLPRHRPTCQDVVETGRAMRGKGIEIAFAALAVVSAAALIASVAVFVLH